MSEHDRPNRRQFLLFTLGGTTLVSGVAGWPACNPRGNPSRADGGLPAPPIPVATPASGNAPADALRDKLRVDLTVKEEPGRLVVETALSNSSAQTVHVFNVLWDFSPAGPQVGPDSAAYVCIADGELRLARLPLPNPVGKKFLVAIAPYLTAIAPGAVLREQMSFALPVQEYSCYFRRQEDSPVDRVEASRARFAYGIAVGATEGAFGPAPIGGALHLINPTKIAGVVTIESSAVPCKVQVMRRRDAFQRF